MDQDKITHHLTKNQAIEIWGTEAVELARDYYETDIDKVLFKEDSWNEECYPASPYDVTERCSRAFYNLRWDK